MRSLARGLSVELAADRKGDGRARGGGRSRDDSPMVDQDDAGACRCFVGASARRILAGGRTKLTSRSTASGNTCTGRWTARATPSCCVRTAISPQRGAFSNAPSTCMACPRRSRSTRAAPTRQPSSASAPTAARTSRCGYRSTLTIWSSEIIAASDASCDRCSDSSRFVVLALSSRASRPCTWSRRGSSFSPKTEPRLLVTSSTLWLCKADRFEVAFTLSAIATEPFLCLTP